MSKHTRSVVRHFRGRGLVAVVISWAATVHAQEPVPKNYDVRTPVATDFIVSKPVISLLDPLDYATASLRLSRTDFILATPGFPVLDIRSPHDYVTAAGWLYATGTDFWRPVAAQDSPAPPKKLSEYWIGVDGVPADDTLRSQLSLADGQGLVLNLVVEDSPAGKAGLKQHDVLIAAADKPLGKIDDLSAVKEEKKDQPIALKLVRAGKQIIVEVKPERRPPSQTGETCPAISRVDDAAFIRRAALDALGKTLTAEEEKAFADDKTAGKRAQLVLKLLRQQNASNKSCTACHTAPDQASVKIWRDIVRGDRLFASADENAAPAHAIPFIQWESKLGEHLLGTVDLNNLLPQGTAQERVLLERLVAPHAAVASDPPIEMPDDLKVTVTLEGKQRVKVTVKKGDATHETTADKLVEQKDLPENVRQYVERMLGRHGELTFSPDGQALRVWKGASDHAIRLWEGALGTSKEIVLFNEPTAPVAPNPAAAIDRAAKQLDSLRHKLDEVTKAIEDAKKSLPRDEAKPDGEKK